MSEQHESTQTPSSRGWSRWMKFGVCLLLLICAGTAGAFHFLGKGRQTTQPKEYEAPDLKQAKTKEDEAKTQREKDQAALKVAKQKVTESQTAYETAVKQRDSASTPEEQAAVQKMVDSAKRQLEDAQAQLKLAEDRLKTDEERLAEAKAERERIAKIAEQEADYKKRLLGIWTREADYGQMDMSLKDDGTGVMTVHFNGAKAFLLGTKQVEIDISWKVAGGNHIVFESLKGRPERTFTVLTKLKGTHRDEVIMKLTDQKFQTHDANDKEKIRNWTRIDPPADKS